MTTVYLSNENFKVKEDPNPNDLVVCRICESFLCWIGNQRDQSEHVELHQERGDC